jgi:hypothetical protein
MWGCNSTSQQRAASGSDCYRVNLVDEDPCYSIGNYLYYNTGSCPSSSHSEDGPGKCRSLADARAYCGSKSQPITWNLSVSEACFVNRSMWNQYTRNCYGAAGCVESYGSTATGFPGMSFKDGWKPSDYYAGTSALESYCRRSCNTTSSVYPSRTPYQICGSDLLAKPPFQWPFYKGFRCSYSRLNPSYTLFGCSRAPAWDGALSGGRNVFDADRMQGSHFGGRVTIPPVDAAAKLVPMLQLDCDFTLAFRLNSRLGLALSLMELRNVYDFASDKVILDPTILLNPW